jgi:hypothetical protein
MIMNNEIHKMTKGYENPLCHMLSVETANVLCQSFGSTTENFNVDDTAFEW